MGHEERQGERRQLMEAVLDRLTDDEAEELWIYLDSTDHVASEMIGYLSETRPEVHDKLCCD